MMFPVEETIRMRRRVRTYDKRQVDLSMKERINGICSGFAESAGVQGNVSADR